MKVPPSPKYDELAEVGVTHEAGVSVTKPTHQQPKEPSEAAVTYRQRKRTPAAAGPREGMVVSSLLFSRLQQTNPLVKQAASKQACRRKGWLWPFLSTPWHCRNTDTVVEASISSGFSEGLSDGPALSPQPFKWEPL